jgi:hypothetical protein
MHSSVIGGLQDTWNNWRRSGFFLNVSFVFMQEVYIVETVLCVLTEWHV